MKKNNQKLFKVFYLFGGWSNMVNRCVEGTFTADKANEQLTELNKMGYPAQKIEYKNKPVSGYFISAFECINDDERKKHYLTARAIGFAPVNQFQ